MEWNDVKVKLKHIKDRADKISADADGVSALIGVDYDKYNVELSELAIDSEILALNSREIVMKSSGGEKERIVHEISALHDILITRENNLIKIDMPPLPIKSRKYISSNFVTTPLWNAAEDFIKHHTVEKIDQCLITVCHLYPGEKASFRVGDYDNREMKKVLDIVSLFFLIDDNCQHCDVLYTSHESNTCRTVITLRNIGANSNELCCNSSNYELGTFNIEKYR